MTLGRTRADIVFEEAYAGFRKISFPAARSALARADQKLYASWAGIRSVEELRWTPDENGATEPRDLARAATAFKLALRQEPDYSHDGAVRSATQFLQSPIASVPETEFLNSLYLDVLRRGLYWIDLQQVRSKYLNAIQILQTVMLHRLTVSPTQEELSVRMRQQRDIVMDEAALIFLYARTSAEDVSNPVTVKRARGLFGREMIVKWQDAAIGQVLMPSSPIPPAHTSFWFDGQVMQGTRGLSLEQIVDNICATMPDGTPHAMETGAMKVLLDNTTRVRHLPGQPPQMLTNAQYRALATDIGADGYASSRYAYAEGAMQIGDAWLNRPKLRAIVQQTMYHLKLDSYYPGGTVLNAIATTALRLGPLHNIAFAPFGPPETLIPTYNQLLQAWHDEPHFPLSPALLAAFHLSCTSGVRLLRLRPNEIGDLQIMRRVRDQVLPALTTAGGTIGGDIEYWSAFIDGLFFPEAARVMAHVPAKQAYASIESGIVALVHALRHPFEIIRYENSTDLTQHLLDYLHQRLTALKAMPVVDSDLLRRQILRLKFNMPESDLQTQRRVHYSQHVPDLSQYEEFQTPPAEFLFRSTHKYSKIMQFNGTEIDVAEQLQASLDAIAKKLSSQHIVVAKANEIVRLRTQSKDKLAVKEIATDIADGIATKKNSSSVTGMLGRLDYIFISPVMAYAARIARLVPFVAPAWDIEEGIRLGDHSRTSRGAINLAVDVLMTMLGAGAGSYVRKFASYETIGTLEQEAAIVSDPHAVHATALANQPDSFALLENEGRRAPVRNTVIGPVETDLHDNAVADAPPISCNGQNTCHAMLREHGLPGGIAGIESNRLRARPTVKSVSSYWSGVMQIPDVRIRHKNIKAVINTLFTDVAHADYKSFHDFWLLAYARSDTAATIVNARYEALLHTGRKAILDFGAERACRIGPKICFLNDNALREHFYLSPRGPVAFQKKRMWLHESIHWLTNLKDMPDDMLHLGRGPTVYLTDRVLSEIGDLPLAAPRITYKLPDALSMPHYDAARPHEWGRTVRQLNEWTVAENVLLDKLLDMGASDSVAGRIILGQPVGQRRTVQQSLELLMHLRSFGILADGNHLRVYEWLADVFHMSTTDPSIRPFLKELVQQSETFRLLAAAWSSVLHPSHINFETGSFERSMLVEGFRCRLAHRVAAGGDSVLLNNQELHFFSEKDLVRMDSRRQVVGAMVEIFLRDFLPDLFTRRLSASYENRGIAILLENTIMRQIDPSSVDRICDMLTTSRHAFLTDQTTVVRAAKMEDAYLRDLILKNAASYNEGAGLTESQLKLTLVDLLGL